jgi:hypothetical protein
LAAAKRCNDGRSGAGATLPSAPAALRDYSLLIDVRTPGGESVFGTCLPLSRDSRGCVEAVGAAAAPVRAASMPPVATVVPPAPAGMPLTGLPHTGDRDVRDLRCSVAFVRHSTAEIARCWRDATPLSNALMRCLFVGAAYPGTAPAHDAHSLSLTFRLESVLEENGTLTHGAQLAPACFTSYPGPGEANVVLPAVQTLALMFFLELQPVAASPAGATLCMLPRGDASLYIVHKHGRKEDYDP